MKDSKDSKNVDADRSRNGLDLAADAVGHHGLTVGVNNVFDRHPPSVLGAFNDNYDTSLYSIRNRYYYVEPEQEVLSVTKVKHCKRRVAEMPPAFCFVHT